MKRSVIIILCLAMIFALPGCGKTSESSEPAPVTDTQSQEAAPEIEDETENIDVDLTTLSNTMVYSEVYNMVMNPDDYEGKIVKMNGLFAVYYDEQANKYYFGCIIQDATACCAQGIEFELAGEHVFPDDYPEVNDEISVIGEFDTYEDGNYIYCVLRNAKFV
ncbi:MAG: hypothetical protein K6D56_06920 [Clostridia bacterium]|nr:hypothetical protein [Clostridia bacterium]